jgi:hypothetical protein
VYVSHSKSQTKLCTRSVISSFKSSSPSRKKKESNSKKRSACKQKEETALHELRELAINCDGSADFMEKLCRVLQGL